MKHRPRRSDLPVELYEREAKLCEAIKVLEEFFPDTGLMIMAFDTDTTEGYMSYISNCRRSDTIKALEDQLARFKMGTDDTAGREV